MPLRTLRTGNKAIPLFIGMRMFGPKPPRAPFDPRYQKGNEKPGLISSIFNGPKNRRNKMAQAGNQAAALPQGYYPINPRYPQAYARYPAVSRYPIVPGMRTDPRFRGASMPVAVQPMPGMRYRTMPQAAMRRDIPEPAFSQRAGPVYGRNPAIRQRAAKPQKPKRDWNKTAARAEEVIFKKF